MAALFSRSLLAQGCRTLSRRPDHCLPSRTGQPAAETPRGFGRFGVGLPAAPAAGREGKAVAGSPRGPPPRPRPRPETGPCLLARQGAAPAPPGSPRRGGTFPTGSDPGQSRGTGAPQPVCQGNPSGCVLGGGGGWVRKKRGGFARSGRRRRTAPAPFPSASSGAGAAVRRSSRPLAMALA